MLNLVHLLDPAQSQCFNQAFLKTVVSPIIVVVVADRCMQPSDAVALREHLERLAFAREGLLQHAGGRVARQRVDGVLGMQGRRRA